MRWIVIGGIVLISLLAGAAAWGQGAPRCGPVNAMKTLIEERFGEELHTWAVNDFDRLIQVWRSRVGTWTMTEANSQTGGMCIIATGRYGWDLPPPGDPA